MSQQLKIGGSADSAFLPVDGQSEFVL
jgi:ATP-dependent DNA helicase RecG